MDTFDTAPATENEKIWAANLMASTDPWAFLGITLDQCLAACSDQNNRVYILHSNREPVGVIILQESGVAGSPYIKSLAVAATQRGKGLGKMLLDFAEDFYCRSSKHLFLCVSSFNETAIKFYRENGYEQVGEFKDHIVKGYDELLLHKWLP